MTRTLILLVALYLLWRVAGILGRRRDREFLQRQRRMGRTVDLVRCSQCGRYIREDEAEWRSGVLGRRPRCRGGCHRPDDDDELE